MAITYLIRRLDPIVWRRLKTIAARDGTPMQTIILRLISDYVAADGKRSNRRTA